MNRVCHPRTRPRRAGLRFAGLLELLVAQRRARLPGSGLKLTRSESSWPNSFVPRAGTETGRSWASPDSKSAPRRLGLS